ncbi:MAG: hypothetical protein K8R53_07870 [Bacteroidales bacterium]|nr:hypothetical protein [Bacteroidales bacterium]
MKTKFLYYIFALFIISWPGLSISQPISTTVATDQFCPGDIVVPVSVTNCNGIGAISLVLQFNTTTLTYLSYENVHPQLTGGNLIVNQVSDKIYIGWASSTAANVGNGMLIALRFSGATGTSSLTWDTQTQGNCEYSDVNGNVLPSTFTNGTVTVYGFPTVNQQPVDHTVLAGQNTNFSISASGSGLSYRWQISPDNGNNWVDLNNGGYYSGVTNPTLNVNNVQFEMNGFWYRCRVEGICTPNAFSDPGVLTVIFPITTSVPTQYYCPGLLEIPVTADTLKGVAAFSMALAYNSSVLTYQGYQNVDPMFSGGNFVVNATPSHVYITWASTTPITSISVDMVELLFQSVTGTGTFVWDTQTAGACEYSDLNGNEIISVFTNGQANIYVTPQITNQPVNRVVPENTNTNFSLTALGSGLAYQWQISTDGGTVWNDLNNGGHYIGVTNPTLNITNCLLSMNDYMYRCIVGGYCPPIVNSNEVTLTVLANITTICGTVAECPGPLNVPVNVTHFVNVASFSLTLNFNESALTWNGYQNLHPSLSGGDFIANAAGGKVYITWTSTTPVSFGDDLLIEFLFTGVTGVSALTWDTQTLGNCEYSDINGNLIYTTFTNGNATVHSIPAITSHPVNKTVLAGVNATFSVTATGTGLSYNWQESSDGGSNWNFISNGTYYSGATAATLTVKTPPLSFNGNMYRCRVSGTCPPELFSDTATLYVLNFISTSASNVSNSCSGNISLPVDVSNCTGVGAISLTLNYNPSLLEYSGYENLHSEISTGFLIVNAAGGQVKMSWASTNPADIGTGTLINFKFTADPGISTPVTWDTQTPGNCEYSDVNGNIIPSVYYNGTITVVANALVVSAGNDTTINQGSTIQLNGSVSGGTGPYNYSWTPTDWLSNPTIADPMANPPVTTTYTLTVTDNIGCYGLDDMTITVESVGFDVSLKAYFEGPFNGSSMNTTLNSQSYLPLNQPYNISPWNYTGMESVTAIPNLNVVDWVLVELRDAADAASAGSVTRIARQAGFILNSGNIVATDGSSPMLFNVTITQNLFAVIWHRNHLAVISGNPLMQVGNTFSYDFSTGVNQVYGGINAHKEVGMGIWGLIGGDGKPDGQINNGDKLDVWVPQAGSSGYYAGDFNLDGQVNNNDKNDLWKPNGGKATQVPF